MSDLSTQAKRAVQAEFRGQQISYGEPPEPIITVAPVHPDFGPIEVLDDEVELTVHCGRFTHVHISNYDEGITPEEHNTRVVASLVTLLHEIFADRVEFWGSHRSGGGFRTRGSQGPVSKALGVTEAEFTWSGPIKNGRTG